MSRFLVTGGAGFIGSNYVRFLLQKYPEATVTNLDKLTYAGNLLSLSDVVEHPRFTFVQADIADREAESARSRRHRKRAAMNRFHGVPACQLNQDGIGVGSHVHQLLPV